MPEAESAFCEDLKVWGAEDPEILGIALIGSHARGTARPDSDIDVIVLVNSPSRFLDAATWVERFGTPSLISDEDWGLVQSKRVRYDDGKEVEFGVTTAAWVHTSPVDPASAEIAVAGLTIIHDPQGLLSRFLEALSRAASN